MVRNAITDVNKLIFAMVIKKSSKTPTSVSHIHMTFKAH